MPFLSDRLEGWFGKDGRRFTLTHDFVYVTHVEPETFGYSDAGIPRSDTGGLILVVPAGYVTDFASTPDWLWSLAPPIGLVSWPACIHDWLYSKHPAGRPWCDKVLEEAMSENGVCSFLQWAYWAGVRIGGRKPYDDSH